MGKLLVIHGTQISARVLYGIRPDLLWHLEAGHLALQLVGPCGHDRVTDEVDLVLIACPTGPSAKLPIVAHPFTETRQTVVCPGVKLFPAQPRAIDEQAYAGIQYDDHDPLPCIQV